MLLTGKIVIVTGGARPRGIGEASVKLFAEHGARIAVLDKDGEGAVRLAGSLGEQHLGLGCDVTGEEDCRHAVATVLERFGHVDVLFNNAGITQPRKLMDISGADWDAVLAVSLRGTMNMSQAIVPHLRGRKAGSIVNMSSVSAQRGGGIFGGPHYSAAKAGVLGLTKAMARELAPDNIRVNAICPSLIDTDLVAGMMTDERRREIVASVPMGRTGAAREVASCALFLASDLSSYVTGSEIDVNGGSHIH
jgi:NAD(P)-dependent dehydrogenase (short-subunit alcohol dehydrogenase family)